MEHPVQIKTKHSAGPWKVDGTCVLQKSTSRLIAQLIVETKRAVPIPEVIGNARLIAAVPELLGLTQQLIHQYQDNHCTDSLLYKMAEGALAVAAGEPLRKQRFLPINCTQCGNRAWVYLPRGNRIICQRCDYDSDNLG